MATQSPQIYHIIAYQFEGQDRAGQVVDLIRKNRRAGEYKVPAWATVEVDDKGKARVRQSGHGGMGAAVGAGAGVVLGLIGGPAGLLAWTLGSALLGGIAGKHIGHQFDANELKALAVGMSPNTSAIIVVIEDKLAQEAAKAMGEYGAKAITLTVGDQISGELATWAGVEIGEGADDEAGEAVDEAAASGA